MLRITDIQNNRVEWASVPRCECDEPAKYLLRVGDIVIARTGATTGKSFLLREVPEPSVFASYLIRVQPTGAVTPEYLASYMQSPTYWAQITTVSKGTAQPGANASILGGLELPLAPLKEQRRIVAKLDALQARSRRAREALDAVPPLLEKLRQSILAAAFRGDLTKDWRAKHKNVEPATKLLERIRTERRKKWEESELAKMKAKGKPPTDDKWKVKYKEPEPVDSAGLPELPEGWCWASVELVTTRVTDGTHQPPPTTPSGIPFIGIRNIIRTTVDWSTVDKWVSPETHRALSSVCTPEHGDLLYTAVGATFGRAVVVGDWEPFVFQRHIALLKLLRKVILPNYAEPLLNAPSVFAQAKLAARGAAQPTVTLGEMSRFVLPIAPVSEQLEIATRLSALLERLDGLAREHLGFSNRCAGLDRAVLAKAFRGELVPQDPKDESAEVMLTRLRAQSAIEDGAPVSAKRTTARRRKAG